MTATARKPASLAPLQVSLGATARAGRAPSASGFPATLQMFQNIAEQLTTSYESLSSEVATLKDELKAADVELSIQLQEKEALNQRLQTLLSALPAAVLTLNAQGIVDDANGRAADLLGAHIIGRRWIDLLTEVLLETSACGGEMVLRNGRVVSVATQPLSERGGQVVVLNDVTETRRLQGRIHHLEKLSEMGRMMASLAHQIRTPLSSAMIFAEHLQSAETDELRRKRFAGRIMEKLTQLDAQVRDMLIFSKSGFLLNDRVAMEDLAGAFRSMALELVDQRGGQCDLVLRPETGVMLQCNRAYLLSCFGNLVENALQACDEHGITPHLQLSMIATDSTVNLRLRDNGPGIAEASLHKVLEPFYTTKPSGTGLGLPVVYAIVTGHGGALELHNDPEGGLVVDIQLPLAKPVTTH